MVGYTMDYCVTPGNKKILELVLENYRWPGPKKILLEQYETPSHIVAEIMWFAYMRKWVKNREIIDLGSGSCRYSIAACLLGAKRIIALDVDPDASRVCLDNLEATHCCRNITSLVVGDVNSLPLRPGYKVDLVVMNPPFGVHKRHADRMFLQVAFTLSDRIISIHKAGNYEFLRRLGEEYGFTARILGRTSIGIPMSRESHRRRIYYVDVDILIFHKQEQVARQGAASDEK